MKHYVLLLNLLFSSIQIHAANELNNLEWLVGNWKCSREFLIPKPENPKKEEGELKYYWDIQNNWLVSDYLAKGDKGNSLTRCFYGIATEEKSYEIICLGSNKTDFVPILKAPFSDAQAPQFRGPSKYMGAKYNYAKLYQKISEKEYIVHQLSEPQDKKGQLFKADIHCLKD